MGCFGRLDHIEMSETQLSIKNGSILFLIWLTIFNLAVELPLPLLLPNKTLNRTPMNV